MIAKHSPTAVGLRNQRKFCNAIETLPGWWTIEEMVALTKIPKRSIQRLVSRGMLDKAIEMGADLSTDHFRVYRKIADKEVVIRKHRKITIPEKTKEIWKTQLYGWGVRQNTPWTVAKASSACCIAHAWIEAYLRSEEAAGKFEAVGRVQVRNKLQVNVYVANAQVKATCDNLFRFIARYGHDEDFVHREPAESTHYPPGSPQKVEVMAARVGRGESPYHPNDVRVGASGHESDGGCEWLPAIRLVDTAATGRVMRKAIS
jgi:hypothetical protein